MKKQPKKKKKTPAARKKESNPTWVDDLEFIPAREADGDPSLSDEESAQKISIISWNVLAEAYCSARSHPNLPDAKIVFDRSARRRLMFNTLYKFCQMADIICLQEVDIDVQTKLKSWGFTGVETPTTRGGGSGGRVDCCGIYVRMERYELQEVEQIAMDDLASLATEPATSAEDSSRRGAIEGSADKSILMITLGQAFLRRNVGILVRLEDKNSGHTLVVANAHLYWNPNFEYVKLCQAHYLMVRLHNFLRSSEEPFLIAGDLNSRPNGAAHSYLTRHGINAKRISPWYNFNEVDADLPDLNRLTLSDDDRPPRIRYLLDATLNKFCRWLRILGQDAEIESEAEEQDRTLNGNFGHIFRRAKSEGRVLVTTSIRLLQRRDCPAGAYCLHPGSLPHLEVALVHMLRAHGIVLEPKTFLSRCVVCNGHIGEVSDPVRQRAILEEYAAPVLPDLKVYECDGCRQGYWWCDKPTSSASRVKIQVTRLFEVCLRGGIPVKGGIPSLFDHIDVETQKNKGWDFSEPGSDLLRQRLDVMDWLVNDWLPCPSRLDSLYSQHDADGNVSGERIPFTNVTDSFVNVLDYIFLPKEVFDVQARLYIPTSFKALNTVNVGRGHLLPSRVWPSDHLAVGGVFKLRGNGPNKNIIKPEDIQFCVPLDAKGSAPPPRIQTSELPPAHPDRCGCGCVPKGIPSLFEMAELRKQARIKANTAKVT